MDGALTLLPCGSYLSIGKVAALLWRVLPPCISMPAAMWGGSSRTLLWEWLMTKLFPWKKRDSWKIQPYWSPGDSTPMPSYPSSSPTRQRPLFGGSPANRWPFSSRVLPPQSVDLYCVMGTILSCPWDRSYLSVPVGQICHNSSLCCSLEGRRVFTA